MHDNSRHNGLITDLIDRLGRLNAAEEWNGPLNPSQYAALSYLRRANRFSRAPSHVADYLATTRGTASQTLKALARKALISEVRSTEDKRSIRYDVTEAGHQLLCAQSGMTKAIENLPVDKTEALSDGLTALVLEVLDQRGGKSFGICGTCNHHRKIPGGGHCQLLKVSLKPFEVRQICHEHTLKKGVKI